MNYSAYFHNIKFIKSVFDIKNAPKDNKKIIIFVGRSNVGKSSLINSLCNNNKMVKTSSKPGKTISLNYFLVDNNLYFVDSPGYGYSYKNNSFSLLMNSFFKKMRNHIKGVIFMLDSRRKLSINDKIFYNNFLIKKKIPFFIILSKIDKITNKQINFAINEIKKNFLIVKKEEILLSSKKNKDNINKIKKQIFFLINSKPITY